MDRTLMVIHIKPVIGFATALTLNRILALTLTLSRYISPGKQERASPALVQVLTTNRIQGKLPRVQRKSKSSIIT
jgi:hypothetical protein